jgi:hypothetical protein
MLIDTDPMFTQVQYETAEGFTPGNSGMRELVHGHTHHFTFGENFGGAGCRMPHCGMSWRPTRQPLMLDRWSVTDPPIGAAYTTLMNWTAARPMRYAGEVWGQKDVEFLKVINLPRQLPQMQFAAVVGQTTGAPFPTDVARQSGWDVLDPNRHAGDWGSYREFLRRSAGEFSVAKETYVKAHTGWFSCRSACYLAAGRPVVTQDTGWSKFYPTGEGLFAFTDAAGAADALHSVAADPARHGRAAREIAEEFFDARRVLGRLLQEVGA